MDRRLLLNDFIKALKQLENVLATPHEDDLERAGCIQYFEFCFELSWKNIKIFCHEQGLNNCNSPKKALQQAFMPGWIDNEEIWLEMLADRNRIAHTYDADEALQIYDHLPSFLPELMKLSKTLQKEIGG